MHAKGDVQLLMATVERLNSGGEGGRTLGNLSAAEPQFIGVHASELRRTEGVRTEMRRKLGLRSVGARAA